MNQMLICILLGIIALILVIGIPIALFYGLYQLFYILLNDGIPLGYTWLIIIILGLLICRTFVWIR
jgi:hypothetical protein